MKKCIIALLILGLWAGGERALAQEPNSKEPVGKKGIITLTPDSVVGPFGEYFYWVGGKHLFLTKNPELYQKFKKKGVHQIIEIEGPELKPLYYWTPAQWRDLSKELKKTFPRIAFDDLNEVKFYLLMNYEVRNADVPLTTYQRTQTGNVGVFTEVDVPDEVVEITPTRTSVIRRGVIRR